MIDGVGACAGWADLMNRDARTEHRCRQKVSARSRNQQGLGQHQRHAHRTRMYTYSFVASMGAAPVSGKKQRMVSQNFHWPLGNTCDLGLPKRPSMAIASLRRPSKHWLANMSTNAACGVCCLTCGG